VVCIDSQLAKYRFGWTSNNFRKAPTVKYVIITPVRNEEAYIRFTLDSVVTQSVRPDRWIIADDGSTDDTGKIIQEYVERHPWMRQVTLPVGTGGRELGGRVVRVFYEGYRFIDAEYDFIVKLDGDLSFASDYFERLLRKFAEDSRLGIAGGVLYVPHGTQWRLESVPLDHVRGATKVYRKACFDEIAGLPLVNGWDGIDEWRAQMKGWKTRSYNDLIVHHHRPTGAAFGKWAGYANEGDYAFYLGYTWSIILARSVYRCLSERPPLVRGTALFWGYLKSWLARRPRVDDPKVVAYMRRKQMHRILFFRRSEPR
jgi:poly-beta-1,6-N-acetyl-D-glucosamine synthase